MDYPRRISPRGRRRGARSRTLCVLRDEEARGATNLGSARVVTAHGQGENCASTAMQCPGRRPNPTPSAGRNDRVSPGPATRRRSRSQPTPSNSHRHGCGRDRSRRSCQRQQSPDHLVLLTLDALPRSIFQSTAAPLPLTAWQPVPLTCHYHRQDVATPDRSRPSTGQQTRSISARPRVFQAESAISGLIATTAATDVGPDTLCARRIARPVIDLG